MRYTAGRTLFLASITALYGCRTETLRMLGTEVRVVDSTEDVQAARNGQEHVWLVDLWVRSEEGAPAWLIIACGVGSPLVVGEAGNTIVPIDAVPGGLERHATTGGYAFERVYDRDPSSCAYLFPTSPRGDLVLSKLPIITGPKGDAHICTASSVEASEQPGEIVPVVAEGNLPAIVSFRSAFPHVDFGKTITRLKLGSAKCMRMSVAASTWY